MIKLKNTKDFKIYVAMKHMGNITKKIKNYPFMLQKKPCTVMELVEEMVISCVSSFKERAKNAKSPMPLTDEQYTAMQEIGKLAFGVHYNEKEIDVEKAVQVASDAIKDGLVRIFKDNDELTDLNGKIDINEGDSFTVVRLTMLSGRMW